MSSNDDTPSDLIRARDVGGFDVWSLPSFDPHQPAPEPEPEPEEAPPQMEEVPLEEVQPLTLEELESIRQEAYNEGFSTGEKEGFHSTTLKVRQEADAALALKLASLERLMSHLMEPIAEQDMQIEKAMVGLVEHIARQVIQRELLLDSSHIESVMREALKLLPLGVGNVRLHINPQDFEQVKALRERHEETWRIVEDAALQPGGCRVETEHSRIDASIETRISQIMAKLFDQLHEQALHPAEPDLSIDLDEVPAQPEASIEAEESPVEPEASVEAEQAPVEPEASIEAEESPAEPEASAEAEQAPVEPEASIEAEESPVEPEASVEAEQAPAEPEASIEAEERPVEPEASVEAEESPVEPEASVEAEEAAAEPEAGIEAEEAAAEPEAGIEAEENQPRPSAQDTPNAP